MGLGSMIEYIAGNFEYQRVVDWYKALQYGQMMYSRPSKASPC